MTPPEKEIQHSVIRLLRLARCWVGSTSQVRPSMVALGLPDLIVFAPSPAPGIQGGFCFFETKRPGGKLSDTQEAFRDRCLQAGVRYVWGGIEEAKEWLVEVKLASRRNGVFQIGRAA